VIACYLIYRVVVRRKTDSDTNKGMAVRAVHNLDVNEKRKQRAGKTALGCRAKDGMCIAVT